jgi:isoquinoline 1-oxidoreductase beta subunit
LGGGFGRRTVSDVAVEAARLSAAAGRPVHVGWNRRDEFQNGFLRPPTHHVLRGALDTTGNILALEHQQASGDVFFQFMPGFVPPIMGADFAAWRGARTQYGIPHRRTTAQRVDLWPLRTGFWRGLGLLANTFAVESFMDELAHAAGIDPLTLRLSHLPEGELGERYRVVLETLAEKSGWGNPAPTGRARGLACCVDVNTVVGQVAEVSVDDGAIRVHHVTSVVDCGLVVNPNIAAQQTEGAITMGLSSTLLEAVTLTGGEIVATNFNEYPLLTVDMAPEIDVTFVGSGPAPLGMGEPPIGPIAAAVANAVFALTGQRLRELPLKLG